MTSADTAADPWAWVEQAASIAPERVFIETAAGDRITYAAARDLAERYAGALHLCGVRPGDRVALQAEKSPTYVLLYLACLRLGAILLPLNTAYTAAEMDYFLGDAEPTLLLVDPDRKATLKTLACSRAIQRIETLDSRGQGSFTALAENATPLRERHRAHGDDIAVLLYTSGTTGRSKGAMLTRSNLYTNAQTLVHIWRFDQEDVLLHALPIFHIHGLLVATNTVLASAASMLLLPNFDAEQLVKLFARATVLMGVPTFYTRLLRQPGLSRESTAPMRLFISGSAPLLAETHLQFHDRTGHFILERYGMSETLMNTSNPYDGVRAPGSVGLPLPGIEMRITDTATGKTEASDRIGMIEVRGPNVFKGYWRMPDKTKAEFRDDGFFITGDLGRIDERGYVHIVGRGKDLIISGGYNVYPKEVESELDALPGVIESAVIGVPHPDFGEGVTAVVVADKNAAVEPQALLHALSARLAKYKLPKRILFVDELPRNTMGKVQKNVLREHFGRIYES